MSALVVPSNSNLNEVSAGGDDGDTAEFIYSLKQEFPELEFKDRGGTILVDMQGYSFAVASKSLEGAWRINEHAKNVMNNYTMFKNLEATILQDEPDKAGWYIVVNSPEDRTLHMVEDSANRNMSSPSSYCGRIGFNWKKVQILAVGEVEKPVGFDLPR
jgi:hypothetical protein